MSDDTIDLTIGEPDESPSARRRRERRAESSSSSTSTTSKASSDKEDKSLVGRLETAFVKIADQMMARDDAELADAIREERRAMSQGLVSLTASLTPLRPLLVLLLALAEPILAFWRVGRILFYRFLNWRERRVMERQVAMEEYERVQAEQQMGMPVT